MLTAPATTQDGYPPRLPVLSADVQAADEWTFRKYALTVGVLGTIGAVILAVAALLGEPIVGAIVAGLPFALLILWKPEIGLMLLAVYVSFETFVMIGSSTVTKLLGFYTLVALVPHLFMEARLKLREPSLWLSIGFAAWSLLSILAARYPEFAWAQEYRRVQMVGLFFLVVTALYTREQGKAFLWAVWVGSVLAAFAAFFLSPEQRGQVARATIGEMNINQHAKLLISGVFLAGFALSETRRLWRVLVILGLLLVFVGIVRTGSRSNYIAIAAGLMVATLVYRGLPLGRRLMLAAGGLSLIIVVVLAGSALGLFATGLWDRLEDLYRHGLAEGGRLHLWTIYAKMGVSHPFLGVGIGNAQIQVASYIGQYKVAHNDVLTHFAETGLAGLLLYLGFQIVVVYRAWKCGHPMLRAGLVGLWVAANVSSLANPSFDIKPFWIQMGACVIGGLLFVSAPAAATAGSPAPAADGPPAVPLGRARREPA
jgi:O-antigen ligase